MYQNEYRGKQTTDSTETMFSIVPLGACTYRHMSDDDVFHLNVNRLEKGLVSREYPVFYASDDNNLDFIVQQINSSAEFRSFCAEQKKGGTRTRLYYKNLCEFQMLIPNTEEQEKIATFLLTLDTLITLHQRECFSFDFSGESAKTAQKTISWEQRKLGEVFTEYSEKNHEELSPLTIIQGKGTILREESNRNLIYDKAGLKNYKLVNEGDFILHLRSFEGGLEMANSRGIVSPAYHIFHGENADSRFYYPFFRSKYFISVLLKPHVYGIRDGKSIDVEGMKLIRIPCPKIEEQQLIGDYFETLDNLITLHQHKPNKKGHDVLSVMPFKGNQRKPHYLCT